MTWSDEIDEDLVAEWNELVEYFRWLAKIKEEAEARVWSLWQPWLWFMPNSFVVKQYRRHKRRRSETLAAT